MYTIGLPLSLNRTFSFVFHSSHVRTERRNYMGFMHEFPHSRMFDSDLREIIEMYFTVKELPDKWVAFEKLVSGEVEDLKNFVEDLKNFVNKYFDNLSVQNEINNKLDAMAKDGSLSALIQPLFNAYKAEINSDINILKNRMNTFTSLPEGSTTGDAELIDGRTDYKGNAHNNIGEHIRDVTNQLSGEIVEMKNHGVNSDMIGYGMHEIQSYTLADFIEQSVNVGSVSNYTGQTILVKSIPFCDNGYLEFYGYFIKDTQIKLLELSEENNVYTVVKIYPIDVTSGFNKITTDFYISKDNYLGVIVPTNTVCFNTQSDGLAYHLYKTGIMSPNVNDVAVGSVYDSFLKKEDTTFFCDYRIVSREFSRDGVASKNINDKAVTYEKLSNEVRQMFINAGGSKSCNISSLLRNATSTTNIKLLGDSITAGVGSTDRATKSWGGLLKSFLESKFNCAVTNKGISGATSQKLVDEISTLIDDSDNIVILMIGTNNRDGVTLFNNLYSHYEYIANYCVERNIKFIPMACIPATLADESTRNKHMEDINHIISAFAYDYGYELINLYEEFYRYADAKGIEIDELISDNLHPNDDGYYVMFRIICDKLGVKAKIHNATW